MTPAVDTSLSRINVSVSLSVYIRGVHWSGYEYVPTETRGCTGGYG